MPRISNPIIILSTVRRVQTRTTRIQQPTRTPFKQYVCGGRHRLVRNQHVVVTEEEILAHRPELENLISTGVIEIRVGSPVGPLYEFATLVEDPEEDETNPEPAIAELEESDSAVERQDTPNFRAMAKAKLVEYLVEHTGEDPEVLAAMKKSQLLEIVE